MARKTTDKSYPPGIYNRALPGKPPNLWCAYTLTEEIRAKHALKSASVRESCGTGDKRAAASHLASRKREVKDGSWRPIKAGGGSEPTVADYAKQWLASRVEVSIVERERQHLANYALPHIGSLRLHQVKRDDIKAMMAKVNAAISVKTGKRLAPRTAGHVYAVTKRMFSEALEQGAITTNPCSLKARKNELPPNKDKSPEWRAGAIFTRDELEQIISDERIAEYRRVLYALCFLGGLRIGEAVGRRWRDWDPKARPLGRLEVATQLDGQDLKTDAPRAVPVHQVLAKILASWKIEGFELKYGKRPVADEFIVQSRNGMVRPITAWVLLQTDLENLGLRRRRMHDARRTFITLARADGADGSLLRFVTHGRAPTIMDLYTSPPWESLCNEVGKLRVGLRGAGVVEIGSLRNKERW